MIKKIGMKAISLGLPFPETGMTKYAEWKLIKSLLDALKINWVLDVGANRGQYALNLRRIGYRGRIVSFEPGRDAFRLMQTALAKDPLWQGYEMALGSEDVRKPFNVAVDSTEMSSFLKPMDDRWNLKVEEVEVHRLDTILEEIVPDTSKATSILLKMDTQGYDLEVIRGAQGCISKICALQSELSVVPLYHDMPAYLEALMVYHDLGFSLFGIFPAAVNRRSGITELDCLMANLNRATELERRD